MAIVITLLLLNIVLLLTTWRVTVRNRRAIERLRERERRANRVMHDAAVDRGAVLTVIRDHHVEEMVDRRLAV